MDKTFELKTSGGRFHVLSKIGLISLVFLYFYFFCAQALFAGESPSKDKVVLNADRVSYNDETGQASAQGRAVLTYQGATIQAERIDYDAASQTVSAMPLPGERVSLRGGGKILEGDRLDYDLKTREGVLAGARTRIPAGKGTLYVRGGTIDVVPWDTAVSRGMIKGRRRKPEEYVAQWKDVALTTCALDHPHYRIESKRIIFIPGQKVIARRPRIYLGSTYLFTSPLDYVVRLQRKSLQYSIMPYLQSSDEKGTGGGLTGSLAWETGSLSLGTAFWSKVGTEWLVEVEQSIGGGFSLLGGAAYSWDDVGDERLWRPYAALLYRMGGWKAQLAWRSKEYITDQKDSRYKYKGRLDRRPELMVQTPWFKTSSYSWLNLTAVWGAYREELSTGRGNVTSRYGLTFHSYFEKTLGEDVSLFSNSQGSAWFYDQDGGEQQMLQSVTGLRYAMGPIECATAYERRYTWGEGPMLWDQVRESEKFHQKVRFPLGKEIFCSVRGSYDIRDSFWDEFSYSLQWVTDCMEWSLHYTDDRTSGGDDKVGLSMAILAFPDTPASFGQHLEEDPFNVPKDLPGRE